MNKWKICRRIVVVTVLSFLVLEAGLRIAGVAPYRFPPIPQSESVPDDYLIPAEQGLKLNPGKYTITINGGLVAQVTHLADSSRATGPEEMDRGNLPEVFVFGGSFTWGQGLSDEQTFCWKLQEALSGYKIVNFGIEATGTATAFLRLSRLMDSGRVPACAILTYASFHDDRNTLPRRWRAMWKGAIEMQDLSKVRHKYPNLVIDLPRYHLGGNGSLELAPLRFFENGGVAPSFYREWPLRSYLSTMNAAALIHADRDARGGRGAEVSKRLIREFAGLCAKHGARFVLAGVLGDGPTRGILSSVAESGLPAVDISVNTGDPKYNLMPFDSHPNEAANELYARKLLEFLASRGILRAG